LTASQKVLSAPSAPTECVAWEVSYTPGGLIPVAREVSYTSRLHGGPDPGSECGKPPARGGTTRVECRKPPARGRDHLGGRKPARPVEHDSIHSCVVPAIDSAATARNPVPSKSIASDEGVDAGRRREDRGAIRAVLAYRVSRRTSWCLRI
jgi:hypothetical protein